MGDIQTFVKDYGYLVGTYSKSYDKVLYDGVNGVILDYYIKDGKVYEKEKTFAFGKQYDNCTRMVGQVDRFIGWLNDLGYYVEDYQNQIDCEIE